MPGQVLDVRQVSGGGGEQLGVTLRISMPWVELELVPFALLVAADCVIVLGE